MKKMFIKLQCVFQHMASPLRQMNTTVWCKTFLLGLPARPCLSKMNSFTIGCNDKA